MPTRPPSDEQLTIAPLPCARIWRSSCFMHAQTPRRLIALTRSKLSAGSSAASAEREHDAGVVERHVEPAELGDGAVDERGDLVFVGDVAGDAERPVPGGGELVGGGAQRVPVDVGEHDRGAGSGERASGVEPHAGAGAGDEGDLAGEVVGRVHADRPPRAKASAVSVAGRAQDVAHLPDVARDEQADARRAEILPQADEHLRRGDVDERDRLERRGRRRGRRRRPGGGRAAADVLGVGEDEADPRAAGPRRPPRGRCRDAGGGRSTGRPAPGTRPSSATFGRETRKRSSSIETPIPMNSPGSVSNTSTPSIAAMAAMKSARAARP